MKILLRASTAFGLLLLVAATAVAGDGIFGSARPDTATGRSRSSQRRSLVDALSGGPQRPTSNSSNMNRGASWSRTSTPAAPSESFLTRTKHLLMPWSRTPEPMSPTGTRRVYQGATPPSESSNAGGPLSWLFGTSEPKKIETVNDFLGQRRVDGAP